DDDLYCASLKGDRTTHTVDQINAALHKIPNENVFFPLPAPWHFARTGPITVADTWDTEPGPEFYLKRPTFPLSLDCEPDDEFWAGRKDAAYWFTAEVRMLERLSRFPQHPNIVKYHGCRVRKGRVTGVMLDRCEGQDLYHHCLVAGKKVDKEPFLAALASAIDHLHNVVGIVHNDISPIHIMVSPDGTPTLIDFGSAEIAEEEITGDQDVATFFSSDTMNPTARKSRDLAVLDKLRVWLDAPGSLELDRPAVLGKLVPSDGRNNEGAGFFGRPLKGGTKNCVGPATRYRHGRSRQTAGNLCSVRRHFGCWVNG
ncbi:kinase-like domain-containing protein, partial [Podospora aff. communis PSN243]